MLRYRSPNGVPNANSAVGLLILVTYLLTHSLTRSLTHSLTHTLIHLLTYLRTYLCNLAEIATIELDNMDPNFDLSLLTFVTRCKRLRSLELNATVEVSTVEEICRLRMEDKIREFQSAHMKIVKLT